MNNRTRNQTVWKSIKVTTTAGASILESIANSGKLTLELVRAKLTTAIFDSKADDIADSAKNIKYLLDDLAIEILEHLTNTVYIKLKELKPELYESVAGTGELVLVTAIDKLKAMAVTK